MAEKVPLITLDTCVQSSLCIHSTAVGTPAFVLQFGTTLATMIVIVGMALITTDGKGDVGYQKEITNIVKSEDAEHHIDDGTDGSKTREVKQGIERGQLMADIVEGSDTNNDNSPDGGNKQAQMER